MMHENIEKIIEIKILIINDYYSINENHNTKDKRLEPSLFKFSRPGGPVVIILTTGSEVRGFDPGRGRWIFSERKNPEYDFLRKGSKSVGPVS